MDAQITHHIMRFTCTLLRTTMITTYLSDRERENTWSKAGAVVYYESSAKCVDKKERKKEWQTEEKEEKEEEEEET